MKRIIATVLSVILLCMPTVYAEDTFLSRGEVAVMLLSAADDYNPGVQKEDIMKGYEDGELHEERGVTRAEALIMLKRAFGALPTPEGHNARVAIPAESFTDIPDWAQPELDNIFAAGIVAGTSAGIFTPNENVTKKQMELFIGRVFSLFGTNERDDFYAAVNKEALNSLTIKPGRVLSGTLYDLGDKSAEQVKEIIGEIVAGTYEKGSKEQKIADFYKNIMDTESRNKTGIEPIRKYLELIDTAETVSDLVDVQHTLVKELYVPPFMSFGLSIDLKDSTKHMLYFGTTSPSLPKDMYTAETPQTKAYIDYLAENFRLGGETAEKAQKLAEDYYETEKYLAKHMMNREDYANVDKIYNVYTMNDLKKLFPDVDMDSVFSDSGLVKTDAIVVQDKDLTAAFASYFSDENIEALKAVAKFSILSGWGGALNNEFIDASNRFQREFYGTEGEYTEEERASMSLTSVMPEYIGEIYAQKHFSEKAKQDVEKMVSDILAVYRSRLETLDWMSAETKAKAIKKLDSMKVKIGYPDKWETAIDKAEIKSASEGGSYFGNMLSIMEKEVEEGLSKQFEPVDKTEWAMYPFTVNACYSATSNDITFPAGILQAPMYDVNAPYEQNLGGIGYIIAHEITHAFDNNGAKFDENGNAADWWTAADYEAFRGLCTKMTDFYEGAEAVPGITMNGKMTLSENVADQGAVSCLTEIVSGLENPDFKLLYRSMARSWASTANRAYCAYAAQADVHSADKLRVNRVVVNCDEFYEAFGVKEGDGMYVAKEDRIKIW